MAKAVLIHAVIQEYRIILACESPPVQSISCLHSVDRQRHLSIGIIMGQDWKLHQFTSVSQSYPTLCDPIVCSTASCPVHHQLQSVLKLMSIKLLMPSNQLIFCRPLLLLPSIFPSIRVFSNESVLCIRWPKYWSFSFSISTSNEYSGLISFKMDWLDLLAVQGFLKSLLQCHSSKPSILWHSAFFIVQLSHPYTTTGKTIALTRWIFDGKAISAF